MEVVVSAQRQQQPGGVIASVAELNGAGNGGVGREAQRRLTFHLLQPCCSVLLQHRCDAADLSAELAHLESLLGQVPAGGLADCMDYVLFPLLLMADSITAARSGGGMPAQGPGAGTGAADRAPAVPAMSSDRAAEAALRALCVLLRRCPAQDGEMLLALVHRLAPLVQLGRGNAAEEVRLLAVGALGAVLAQAPDKDQQRQRVEAMVPLFEPDNAPLLALVITTLLSCAEGELAAGQQGSKALRGSSLAALHSLLSCPPAQRSPDALAYFIPGLVTGLGKALLAAGQSYGPRGATGSGASSAAAVAALGALVATLRATLGDEAVRPLLLPQPVGGGGSSGDDDGQGRAGLVGEGSGARGGPAATEQALAQLQALAAKSRGGSSTDVEERSASISKDAAAAGPPSSSQAFRRGPHFRVQRSAGWAQSTSQRVSSMLPQLLPPLSSYPRPAVRTALVTGAMQLVDGCSVALHGCLPMLVELVLGGAQDEWAGVSGPCRQWLASGFADPNGQKAALLWPPLEDALLRQVAHLPDAVRQGGEEAARQSARRLSTALQAAPPARLSGLLLHHARNRGRLCDALCQAFEFDREGAQLLLRASVEGGAYGPKQPPLTDAGAAQGPAAPAAGNGADRTGEAGDTIGSTGARPQDQQKQQVHQAIGGAAAAQDTSLAAAPEAVGSGQGGGMGLGTGGDIGSPCAVTQAPMDLEAELEAEADRPADLPDLDTLSLQQAAAAAEVPSAASAPEPPKKQHNTAQTQQQQQQQGSSGAQGPLEGAAPPPTTPPRASARGAAGGSSGSWAASSSKPGQQRQQQQQAAHQRGREGAGLQQLDAPVLLPRMPVGLRYVSSQGAYLALATVARSVGRAAAAADMLAAAPAGGSGGGGGGGRGHALRGLVDLLLERVRDGARHAVGTQGGWQHQVASATTVLAELLFGASPEWKDGWAVRGARASLGTTSSPAAAAGATPQQQQQRSGLAITGAGNTDVRGGKTVEASPELGPVVMMALEAWTEPALWGLPTGVGGPDSPPGLTLQVAGENALLARVLVEAVGASARALGPAFNGRPLRTSLLPLVERLGDPCPMVATAAAAACGSAAAAATGYPDLAACVAANCDYITDGLCRQLRALDQHPRAPSVLAGLLTVAGVPAALLPLFSEPAAAAFKSLSIIARSRRPAFVASFLTALREVLRGAAAEAQEVEAEWDKASDDIQARFRDLNPEQDQGGDEEDDKDEFVDVGSTEGGSAAEARRYFLRHHERKKAADAEGDQQQGGEGYKRVPLSGEQHDQLDDLRRRAHAAACLASTAVSCAAPLLGARDLRCALLAADACAAALCALRGTTAVADGWTQALEPVVAPRGSVTPVPPDPPKVLPAVHIAWAPLVASLRDWRPQVVERSLGLMVDAAIASGGRFLSRRFAQEAWPQLARLLQSGPARRLELGPRQRATSATPGTDSAELAPGAVQRTQAAVLSCLADLGGHAEASVVLSGVAGEAARASLPLLDESQPPAVQKAAAQAMRALAIVDPDGVWYVLQLAQAAASSTSTATTPALSPAASSPTAVGPATATDGGPNQSGTAPATGGGGDRDELLPDLDSLLQPALRDMTPAETRVARDAAAAAARLLQDVRRLPVPWHSTCTDIGLI